MKSLKWEELSEVKRDALIAEHLFGKEIIWIDRGLGLSPYVWDKGAVKSGSGWSNCHIFGAYTVTGTTIAGEEVEICGHHVPGYQEHMAAAWLVLKQVAQLDAADKEVLTEALFGTAWGDLAPFETLNTVCTWTPEKICKAALQAIGIVDSE